MLVFFKRNTWPLVIFVTCALVYVSLAWDRPDGAQHSPHYARFAHAVLDGHLDLTAQEAQGLDDMAMFQGKRFSSFPPFPTLVTLPAVILFGEQLHDGIFWALIAALGPALLFVWLRRLSALGLSERSERENFFLALVMGMGTVFLPCAVQGDVWFSAQVTAVALLAVYAWAATDIRHPVWAGALLGCSFLCRPTTLFAGLWMLTEVWRTGREVGIRRLVSKRALGTLALFALPLLGVGAFSAWFNHVRFGDAFEFGHNLLQVKWSGRIERWGLFNYHYLGKNLAVFTSLVPWLSAEPPHLKISTHGLALWVTSPLLLRVLWPKQVTTAFVGLALACSAVAIMNLLYQNTGWEQFGYRFLLDYLVFVMGMLAVSRVRFGTASIALGIWGMIACGFGALTFCRQYEWYDRDGTQERLFQPD